MVGEQTRLYLALRPFLTCSPGSRRALLAGAHDTDDCDDDCDDATNSLDYFPTTSLQSLLPLTSRDLMVSMIRVTSSLVLPS